jgi:flagellar L-ring protein precursor FlgH
MKFLAVVLTGLIVVHISAMPKAACAMSLWQSGEASCASMFSDSKACRTNDLITVMISETSTATRTATTTTGRETTVDDKVESWFGIKGVWNILKNVIGTGGDVKASPQDSSALPAMKLSAAHDFKGTGTTLRNDAITAKITCKVTEVLPNKNLMIEGRQNVSVNAEEQILVLSGIIRPQDVTVDNTVYSYNVMDAKISYSGKGPLGDKQRRGFFEWVGDKLWPF